MIATLAELFEGLPHVMFCAKGVDGRYLAINHAFLDRTTVVETAQVLGATAHDLFPAELADSYEAQDAVVLESGRSLRGELELIRRPDGSIGWYVTTKTRLAGSDGTVLGIASVSVDLRAAADGPATSHAGLATAIAFAREHCTDQVRVSDLADLAGVSDQQLDRAMRRMLGVTPKQLLLRFRLEEALVRLASTDAPISEIATDCGYYDQSAFTRQFRRVVGMTPGAYRSSLHH
jgi:AraC-like DNA-binding protein